MHVVANCRLSLDVALRAGGITSIGVDDFRENGELAIDEV
jgi:hypothetical protein